MNALRRFMARLSRAARRRSSAAGKLRCSDCGCQIHRHERYTIIEAKHRDCKDKKLVGQKSFTAREDI